MPVSLPETLKKALDQRVPEAAPLIVGCSGGADSVALLCAAVEVRSSSTVVAAHLHHGLRDAEADEDARWVAELASRLGVTAVIEHQDVRARAVKDGRGIEETARAARYEFLERVAMQHNARHVAVAHTADDQAETVLHHLLRGTGLAGLSGMSLERRLPGGTTLVRPLLTVCRQQLREYLTACGQSFREDSSNTDRHYTRNRIRTELLPLLAQDYNPQVAAHLTSLAQLAADVQEAVVARARTLVDLAVLQQTETEVVLDLTRLTGEPRHFVRETFVELWKRQNWPRQKMDAKHWDDLATLALTREGAIHLPGRLEARCRRETLKIGPVQP